jgi:mRNA-degrading endonuclease RelE of RelBE toxin-antitoxin system
MSYKILLLESFKRDLKKLRKRYKRIEEDLREIGDKLRQNPRAGVALGKNCYKIRLPNSSIPTGKSGGFRVIYYFIDKHYNIYLVTVYSKTELATISEERLIDLLQENGLE